MKIALLAALSILLCLPACPAAAAVWTPLGENDAGTFFIDKTSITGDSGQLQVMTLLNWAEPHPLFGNSKKFYRSEIATTFLDCNTSEVAFGSRTMYGDVNGKGGVVFAIELGQNEVRLRKPSPGSTGDYLKQIVCAK